MTAQAPQRNIAWDGWLRLFVIGYFLGGVIGLWSLWALETFAPGRVSRLQAVLLCALYLPMACLGVGAWLVSKGRYRLLQSTETKELSKKTPTWFTAHSVPVWLALGAFGGWAGSYYASGLFVSSKPMATLWTSLDHAIPLLPESTFVYVTVQWFVVLAIAAAGHVLPWRRIAAAFATNIVVSTLFFLFFPVTMHHKKVPITDLSTWTLSILRAGDIANNCFPSSHCSMALLSALLLFRARPLWGWLGLASALAIGFTTMTTKQHYAADVAAGFALAIASYVIWCRTPNTTHSEGAQR